MKLYAVARTLRQIAADLEAGRYDQAELSAVSPLQYNSATGYMEATGMISVQIVAWKESEHDKEETGGEAVRIPAQSDLRAAG